MGSYRESGKIWKYTKREEDLEYGKQRIPRERGGGISHSEGGLRMSCAADQKGSWSREESAGCQEQKGAMSQKYIELMVYLMYLYGDGLLVPFGKSLGIV